MYISTKNGLGSIADFMSLDNLPMGREEGIAWFAEHVNTFVNVLRPRVRSAVTDNQGALG